ncbi:MAG: EB domain-containing protein [Polyangiales bacterium]
MCETSADCSGGATCVDGRCRTGMPPRDAGDLVDAPRPDARPRTPVGLAIVPSMPRLIVDAPGRVARVLRGGRRA